MGSAGTGHEKRILAVPVKCAGVEYRMVAASNGKCRYWTGEAYSYLYKVQV